MMGAFFLIIAMMVLAITADMMMDEIDIASYLLIVRFYYILLRNGDHNANNSDYDDADN